jgi:glutamine amidotransferase-like uncharacterized protein
MDTQIFIYSGKGADSECVDLTRKSFEKLKFSSGKIISGDISQFKKWSFEGKKCIIFPGGNAVDMARELDDESRKKVNDLVSSGKATLGGFCAGAYLFACPFFREQRSVSLTNAEAIVAAYEVNSPLSDNTARASQFSFEGEASSYYVFWNFGPKFSIPKGNKSVSIIARYEDCNGKPPAVIAENGMVFTGIHPEFFSDTEYLNSYPSIKDTIVSSIPAQKKLFKIVCKRLKLLEEVNLIEGKDE